VIFKNIVLDRPFKFCEAYMKEEAKTKKDLLKELKSLQRKVNRLEKASRKSNNSQAEKIRVPTKELIRQSEARLKRAELASKSGNWELHLDSQIMFSSEGAKKIYGTSKGPLNYKTIKNNPLPQYRPLLDSALKNLIENNQPYDLEFKIKTTGTGKIKDIHSIAEYDKERKIIFGVIQDITSRKRIEDILCESKDQYYSIFKNSIGAIFLTKPDGRILAANPEACRIFDRTEEELCLSGSESIVDITDPRFTALIEERSRTGRFKGELTFIRKDGTKFPGLVATSIYLDKEGNKQTSMVIYDITDQKRAEEEIKTILRTALDGFYLVEMEGRILEANDSYCSMIGYSHEELIKMSVKDVEVVETEEVIKKRIQKISETGSDRFETKHKRKDGRVIDIDVSINLLVQEEAKLVCFMRDITTRKRMEAEIRESQERFQMVFENVFDGISIFSEDTDSSKRKLVECNERYAVMAGRPREELLRLGSTEGFYKLILEDTDSTNRLESLESETAYQGSFSWIRPDGKENIIEYVAKPITWRGMAYSIGIDRDITERKLAKEKLEKYSQELKELNAGKDKLFSIIAHDLRSPFNPLLGISEIMVNDFESLTPEEIKDYNKEIYNSLKNEYKLLENLLNWSRLETGQMEFNPQKINLYDKIESVISLLSGNAKLKDIALVNETDKDIFVSADPVMLNSILQNLISNSIKFTNKDGLIKIYAEKVSNDFIQITVSDNGVGMTNDQTNNLFGLTAASTKGTNDEKGTGLGLMICKEMAERQGGTISVKSEVGKGTDMSFTLPKV
jgi:hypothetical protein